MILIHPPAHDRWNDLHMKDPVLNDLELAKLSNELDIAQHFTLGQKPGFKLILSWLAAILEGYVGL